MSRNHTPGRKTRTAIALEALQTIGGKATLRHWLLAIDWKRSADNFDEEIATRLMTSGLVKMCGEMYVISSYGQEFLQVPVDAPPVAPPVIVAPQYTGEKRTLSAKFITRMPLTREGALDYLKIPSRIGDQRIEHGTKSLADASGEASR